MLRKMEKTDCSSKLEQMVHANDGQTAVRNSERGPRYKAEFGHAGGKARQTLLVRKENKTRGPDAPWKIFKDPNEQDVIMGRGRKSYNHSGNTRFREMVKGLKPTYNKLQKREKTNCSIKLVCMVHANGGQFLNKDDERGLWYEVEFGQARRKASQALREQDRVAA